tara:strand:+ start:623 stop:2239 length:1617 start_codon:yes stop_codon:yes gene_type:complete
MHLVTTLLAPRDELTRYILGLLVAPRSGGTLSVWTLKRLKRTCKEANDVVNYVKPDVYLGEVMAIQTLQTLQKSWTIRGMLLHYSTSSGIAASLTTLTLVELDNRSSRRRQLSRLPETLEELILKHCDHITCLESLPESLKVLTLEECNAVAALDSLPTKLKKLCVTMGARVRPICFDSLPESLMELELELSETETSLDALPETLEVLKLWDYTGIKSLDALPSSLKVLKLNGSIAVTSLDALPSSLVVLELNECYALESLSPPASLKKLRLTKCDIVPRLPDNLVTFVLDDVNLDLGFFDAPFPSSLEMLELCNLTYPVTLEALPVSIEKLVLKNCGDIDLSSMGHVLLKELEIRECHANVDLLPESLVKLHMEHLNGFMCTKRRLSLDSLPTSLKQLTVIACNVTNVDSLPSSLRTLELESIGDHWFKSRRSEVPLYVDSLPQSLKQLTVTDCCIRSIDSLPSSLEKLNLIGVDCKRHQQKIKSITSVRDLHAFLASGPTGHPTPTDDGYESSAPASPKTNKPLVQLTPTIKRTEP